MKHTWCALGLIFIVSLGCSHKSVESKKTIKYLEILQSQDVCALLKRSTIAIDGDDLEFINRMWLRDLNHFEKTLDKITKQKNTLIQTFLWARDKNLVPFPSALYLKDRKNTYGDLQKRLDLMKELEKPLESPSLLQHILKLEIQSFSMKEGEGKAVRVLEDYVRSFILRSAPSDHDFMEWLTKSCLAANSQSSSL